MDERLKTDFPIDWDEDNFVSRREFVKFMTVSSGGFALGSAGLAIWSRRGTSEESHIPKLIAISDDLPVGGWLAFEYPRKGDLCILIRRKDGSLAAFGRRCTHLSCPVEFQSDQDRLYCPCHNGAFAATDGRVLQGPPPHALRRVLLEERNGEVYAVGIAKEISE